MTFTDMLMLLVVMFVLFLSFSEIDSDSFKQNAGAISEAFNQPPPTSILQNSSAIVELSKTNIDFSTRGKNVGFEAKNVELEKIGTSDSDIEKESESVKKESESVKKEKKDKISKNLESRIQKSLNNEIKKGHMQLIKKEDIVILRFPEKVTFQLGSADLNQGIESVLDKVTDVMNSVNGIKKIVVAGHSDSLPISNYEFRSNWDLSAARAVSVVHRLLENKLIDRNLLVVIGLADTEPVLPNTTYANRAANRRVEIKVEF
jgi:chemotaxis protein MotB